MTKQRQRERQARRQAGALIVVVATGSGIFVEFDGVRIAERGHPGTEHAGAWISLEPGWAVYSSPDHSVITIEHNGARVQ